jgi:hypothetical protein
MVESSAYGQGRLIMMGRTGHQYEWYVDDPGLGQLSLYNRGRGGYDLTFNGGNATFTGVLGVGGAAANTDYGISTDKDIKIIKNGARLLLGESVGGGGYGELAWNHSANTITLGTQAGGASTQMVLDGSGNVEFGVANAKISGSSTSTGSFGVLGVGTTGGSNGYGLHIKSTGTSTYPLFIEASDGSNLGGFYEGASGNGHFYIRNADGTAKIALQADGNDASFMAGGITTVGDIISTGANKKISGSLTSTGSFGSLVVPGVSTITGNATFGGTIGSGAITSTAGISGTTGTFSGVVTSNGNHIAVNGANPGLVVVAVKPGFAPFTAM